MNGIKVRDCPYPPERERIGLPGPIDLDELRDGDVVQALNRSESREIADIGVVVSGADEGMGIIVRWLHVGGYRGVGTARAGQREALDASDQVRRVDENTRVCVYPDLVDTRAD